MIERMTHVAVVGKSADKDALLNWMAGERGFHVMPVQAEEKDWKASFKVLPDETQALEQKLNRISAVVSFCQEHQKNKPGFLDTMLPLKVVGTKGDIRSAVAEADVERLHDETSALRTRIEAAQEKVNRLVARRDTVTQFAFLGDALPKLQSFKHLKFVVVSVSGQGGKAFLLDERVRDTVVAEEILADQANVYYALVVPNSEADVLKSLIDDHGLNVQQLPEVKRGAKDELAALASDIAAAQAELAKVKDEAAAYSAQWLRKASLAAGHWESERNLALQRLQMSHSGHMFVSRGYVKDERMEELKGKLERSVPGASLLPFEAPAEEEPPISLKWHKLIQPASLLVKMYGLPSYKGIDPTPFVATIFFLFVGICFGDFMYGLAIIAIMLWLKFKYREQAHLQDFFQVFIYCGLVTMVVGVLTGSFAGDLLAIIPGAEPLNDLRLRLALIDTIKNPTTALYIAVGLGIVTQFYGMVIRTHLYWRRGDKMGALSDGILWMCFFGFLIAAAATGSSLLWGLFLLSTLGLVLTQGRDQKNWVFRILIGAISLYGIVGAYGASAFLGDVISYARLMALNLTSAALGSTFNMLAQLAGQISVVGGIIAILVIIFGHIMNFFLGILGAFVHSARLVMLEFFGRFYEAGGVAYKPYGFNSATVDEKTDG